MDGKNGIVLPSFIFAVTKTASGSDRPSYTVSVPWSIRAPATKIGGLSLKRDRSEHGGIDVASLEFGWFQQCHKVQQNCCHMEPLQVSCSQDKSFYSLQLGNGKVPNQFVGTTIIRFVDTTCDFRCWIASFHSAKMHRSSMLRFLLKILRLLECGELSFISSVYNPHQL